MGALMDKVFTKKQNPRGSFRGDRFVFETVDPVQL
jgi:hypothetical protein